MLKNIHGFKKGANSRSNQSIKGCGASNIYLLWEVWDMQTEESWDRKVICQLAIFHVLILFLRCFPWSLSEMGYQAILAFDLSQYLSSYVSTA